MTVLEPASRLSTYLLKHLDEATRRAGSRLHVVIIGDCQGHLAEHRWVEDSIEQSCRQEGLSCLNLAAPMRGQRDTYCDSNNHWSAKGHEFAARAILELLERP
jgi:hypothetical protein